MAGARRDILGPGFRAKELRVPSRRGEPAIATLVRYEPPGAGQDAARSGPGRQPGGSCQGDRPALLYIHGFVDYFFQRELAERADAAGYDFYAVDLRKYGRSLRPGDLPNYVTDLNDHFSDIDAAVRQVKDRDGHARLIVMGHSMGGLIAPLWAKRRPGVADALVLNSPWLGLRGSWVQRVPLSLALQLLGLIAPRMEVSRLAPYYGQYLSDPAGGGWQYSQEFKPEAGFPVHAAWIAAIRRGQWEVARGLHLACPVLVCCSDETGPDDRWHEKLSSTDSVLAVEDMMRLAPRLGDDVTLEVIAGGIHDLALSPQPARSRYYEAVFTWLAARCPAT